MYNITLVCTRHDELGRCNSSELYQLIEAINPEVIFEEIPPSYFDKYYKLKSHRNLETDAINRYLESHTIEHIPVDADDVPSDLFFQEYEYMLKRIEGLTDYNGFSYRNLTDSNKEYIYSYGFDYLNSVSSDNVQVALYDAIETGLEELKDEKLFRTHHIWKDIQENRENEMLRNIYVHSKNLGYENALFCIGAAHRKSMIKKTKEYNDRETVKLTWFFYNT